MKDKDRLPHLVALKVFCDIARCRSFSQAAALNGVTQSAASQVVHALESRLRAALIDRSTRPLHLTPLGQVYYEGCKKLVEQYMELEAGILQSRAQLAATVQVAAIYSVGLGDMGQYVERFQQDQPQARVQIEYLHPDRVYEKVRDGTADLGLVSFPVRSREMIVAAWREEEMLLACPPDHPLAARASIRPEDLQGAKYVAFERHLTVRRRVDRFLRQHHVTVDVVHEFDNIENIKKDIIEARAGVALLPAPTLRREVAEGVLVARPLVGCRFVRPLGIIYRRQHPLSSFALRFIELLRHPGLNGHSSEPARASTARKSAAHR
jgi:DNA-binding transcriptional LysR family regulator